MKRSKMKLSQYHLLKICLYLFVFHLSDFLLNVCAYVHLYANSTSTKMDMYFILFYFQNTLDIFLYRTLNFKINT